MKRYWLAYSEYQGCIWWNAITLIWAAASANDGGLVVAEGSAWFLQGLGRWW
jgi:hypothetical protein